MTAISHEAALKRAEERRLAEAAKTALTPSRQKYHFMPQQGWMNDPNGLIYFRGQYHFFYQYNPYGAFWDAMHWGHAVSDDLLHWRYLPVALAPSEPYDDHPKGGCFSGSAIEHEGKLYLLYTGSTDEGHGTVQAQCLAVSEDGVHFIKAAENPVITAPEPYSHEAFRDPKLLRHNGLFYAVCGHGEGGRGRALLFSSPDLRRWRFVNVLAQSRGEWGGMWECPDLFPLGERYVLTFSPMNAGDRKAVYFVGDMDWERGVFEPQTQGELDWGFDFYAAQTFADAQGRRVMAAWANEWQWMPWFKGWGPTWRDGWCGFLNALREVRLNEDNTLSLSPVRELQALRTAAMTLTPLLDGDRVAVFETPDPMAFDIDACVDLEKTTAERIVFHLRQGEGRETLITLDLRRGRLTMNRDNADAYSEGELSCPLPLKGASRLPLRILSDVCSVETFALDGRVCMSGNIYAGAAQNRHSVEAVGGAVVWESFAAWGM